MLRRSLLASALAALVLAPAALADSTSVELMPGVTYTRDSRTIDGKPVVLHVVTAPKPGGKLYRLAPVLSDGEVTGRATVSAMQGPLSTSATVVGVNGDLFSYTTDSSSGILMQDGVLLSRPVSRRSSLGIAADGLLSIGRVGFYGRWAVGDGQRRALAQFNRPLDGRGVALFTPGWGAATPKVKNAVDVVILDLPPATPGVDLEGTVASVAEGGGTPIPKDGAVLQAVGPVAAELRAAAVPSTRFVARLDLKPWWEGVGNAIGGGPALVRDGKIVLPTDEEFSAGQLQPRHPRTAVGQLEDGRVVLVAVDGGQAASAGLDVRSLADELLRLGVVNGMALDAGGSTTLAFDGNVLNSPSAGAERRVSNALMLFYYGVYAPAPSAPVVSPNGDGVDEREIVSFKVVRPSTVEARLVGPGGRIFYKDELKREAGTYPFEVDPSIFKEGTWKWVVRATDADGQESKAERTFTVNNTLGFLELSKKSVKVGKKRGATVGITFRVTKPAQVVVSVLDAQGKLVRTLSSRARTAGKVSILWDTRSESGAVVGPGRYTVSVEARNDLGSVTLDAPLTVRRGR